MIKAPGEEKLQNFVQSKKKKKKNARSWLDYE